MDLADHLAGRGLLLQAEWAPRETNVHADRLANGRVDDFDPGLRRRVNFGAPAFGLLNALAAEGRAFYAPGREPKPGGPPRRRAREERLRARDPW